MFSSNKVKGRKQDSLKHKRELERLVLEKQKARDSGYEEEREIDADNAVELMGESSRLHCQPELSNTQEPRYYAVIWVQVALQLCK